jgi:protein-S-isoprenylcysteine O-methyltransferase Ste14
MNLDSIEKWVRRAATFGMLAFVGAVFRGLAQAHHHTAGRVSGPAPSFTRNFLGGSLLLYLPLSTLGIALLAWLWRPLRLTLSPSARAGALLLGSLLYFPGLALMFWGRWTLGAMYNVSSALGAQLYEDHRLIRSGPYALVRHPMYVGGIMAELGMLLIYRTWATLLILLNALSLPQRAHREEEALATEFGDQWQAYTQQVPAWIPRLNRD